MYLYGSGGHAKVIMDILKSSGETVEGVVNPNVDDKEFQGVPISKDMEEMPNSAEMIICVGNNSDRAKIASRLNCKFGKAIHPSAIISDNTTIGEGSVVMQGAIVQTDTQIGRHCIINTGASVDHECQIGDFAHISPHATLCGDVHVGEGTWIGAGAVVIPGVRIGRWSVVGAGSVVTRDIPDNVVAYGNSCKVIRKIK